MQNVMGIIPLTEEDQLLREITYDRPVAAIPFGGRYRLIDFSLSNLVNTGIINVSIFTKGKYRSLIDHLGTGKEWGLQGKRDGLFILPPQQKRPMGNDLALLSNHLDYLKRSKQEYVIITKGSLVCNINYRPFIHQHQENKNDVTIICSGEGNGEFMDSYIMAKALLVDFIYNSMVQQEWKDLRQMLADSAVDLKINKLFHRGYFARIDSIASYYTHSMGLLQPEVQQQLFDNDNPIYTKSKDDGPARYKAGAQVRNSLVANGCIIDGTVENSILFRGVKVEQGAHVANSIIMAKGVIGQGSVVSNAIFDKEVQVGRNSTVSGHSDRPVAVLKKTVI
ncbi:MAG: sugar phosphate nucleotidyltransferase [Bacillota bacterium]|nr:sugar phosphate nucleotidyltransferase [Bacillota bacterium]